MDLKRGSERSVVGNAKSIKVLDRFSFFLFFSFLRVNSTLTWLDDQHHCVRSPLGRSARIFPDIVRRDRCQSQFRHCSSRASFSLHVYSPSCSLETVQTGQMRREIRRINAARNIGRNESFSPFHFFFYPFSPLPSPPPSISLFIPLSLLPGWLYRISPPRIYD